MKSSNDNGRSAPSIPPIKPVGGVRPREAGPIDVPCLWCFPSTLNSGKAHVAMHASSCGDNFRLMPIFAGGMNYHPDFARINQNMSVPALEIDDVIITDSLDIVRYLREKHPGPETAPPSEEITRFVDLVASWDEGVWNYGKLTGVKVHLSGFVNECRLHYLRKYRAEVEAAAAKGSMSDETPPVSNRVLLDAYDAKIKAITEFAAVVGPGEGRDQGAIDAQQAILDNIFEAAEQLLQKNQGQGGYLVGMYSDCDTMMAPIFARLEGEFSYMLPEIYAKHPLLAGYLKTLKKTNCCHRGTFVIAKEMHLALADVVPFFFYKYRYRFAMGVTLAVALAGGIVQWRWRK